MEKEREYTTREKFLVWLFDHPKTYQVFVVTPAVIAIAILYLVVFR
jgi:hypothetical protein